MPPTPEEIKATWTDPEFNQLPEDARIAIMSDLDPRYGGLDRLNRRRIAARFAAQVSGKMPAMQTPASEELAAAEALAQPRLAPPQFGGIAQPPLPIDQPPAVPRNPMARPRPPVAVPSPPFFPGMDGMTMAPQAPAAPPPPQLPPSKPASAARTVARSGPHETILSPAERPEFEKWANDNGIAPTPEYDIRGYWRALKSRDPRVAKSDPQNLPDEWKTPAHPEFSSKSLYAGPDAPKWVGKQLVDSYGDIVKDRGAEEEAKKAAEKREKEDSWVREQFAKVGQKEEDSLLKLARKAADDKLKLERKAEDDKRKLEQKTADLAKKKPEAFGRVVGMEKLGGVPPGVSPPAIPVDEVKAPSLAGDVAGGMVRGAASAAMSVPRALARIPGGFQDDMIALQPSPSDREPNLGFAPGNALQNEAKARQQYADMTQRQEAKALPDAPITGVGKFSEALGSTAPYMVAGALGGTIGSGAMGVLAGVDEATQRADQSGIPLTDAQRFGIAATGAAIGSTEALPFGRLLNRLKGAKVVADTVDETKLIKDLFPSLGKYLGSAGVQFLEEGAQEAGSGLAQDALEAAYGGRPFDKIGAEFVNELATGGGVGALLDVMTTLIGSHAGRARLRSAGIDPEALRDYVASQGPPEMQQEFDGLDREMRGSAAGATPPPSPGPPPPAPAPAPAVPPPTQAEAATPPPPPSRNPMRRPKPAAPEIEEIPADIEELLNADNRPDDEMPPSQQPAPAVGSSNDPVPALPGRPGVGVPGGGVEPAVREVPAGDGNPAGATAVTLSAPARAILAKINELEPITGVAVTTQRLRRAFPEMSKQEFDAAALELSKQREVSLSLHHDPHNQTAADKDLLVDRGDGENYYVALSIRHKPDAPAPAAQGSRGKRPSMAPEGPPANPAGSGSQVQEVAPEPKKEVIQPKPEEAAAPVPGVVKPDREFSSTQVNLPPAVADRVRQTAAKIADDDLTEDGREDDVHATVKFGLHTNDAEEVRALLAGEPPVRVKLGKVSLFENDDADVVKVEVDSPDLHRLNKKIADALPHTDTHPKYQPHVTLAYVKPGRGKKYLDLNDLEGQEITLDAITFSSKDRRKIDIPLGGAITSETVHAPQQVETKAPAISSQKPPANPMKRPASPKLEKHPMSQLWRPPNGADKAATAPVVQTATNESILKQEAVDVEPTPTKPDGSAAIDGTRADDPQALAGTAAEDVQVTPIEGAAKSERVGGAGADQGSTGGVDQRKVDEPGSSQGTSDEGMGATPERTGQPDDRIRANLPDKPSTGRDYRISDDDAIGAGGQREKSRLNLEAVRLLKKLESEKRDATPKEQKQLAKYVGWGGMSQAFDPYNRDWRGVNEELKNTFTPEEYDSARGSTPNAHYTAPEVIKGMWKAMERLGLGKDANVLEPSMGVGHFFGLQPETLLPSRRTGIELDSITGRLAKALYPDASVHVAGFEKVKMPNNYFDLAIGNVPFGDYGVYDPEFKSKPGITSRIHDYFFAKALNKVRPGGVVAFITSHHTMDKSNSTIRKHLSQSADLIGAIRLPNTTFKGNAGTEVTTDIIFLQKRAPGQPAGGEAWLGRDTITGKDGRDIPVNEYFAKHPEMMLGEMALENGMYAANTPTLTGQFSPAALEAAIAKLPQNIITPYDRPATKAAAGTHVSLVPEAGTIKDSGYGIVDGKLVQRVGDEIKPAALTGKNADRVRKLIPIRDAARSVLRVQLDDKSDADLAKAQKDLATAYDSFVKEFGPISEKATVRAYAEDPDLPLLLSLEDFDAEKKTATKTAIFTERTVAKYAPITSAGTAAEAMAISLNEYGRLDWARMQELTGKDPDQLREELGPLVYQNPDGRQWETSESYLSGDVRQKLRDAEAAAGANKAYARNVEALKAIQPVDLKPNEIDARLGASWVPKEVVTLFARETLRAPVTIGHAAAIGAWTVSPGRSGMNSLENTTAWGTNRYNGHELLEMALNSQVPKVYDTYTDHGVTKTVLNEKETIVAQEKHQKLKDRFREWVWENPQRAETLARKYNDEFNNLRLRQYDGSHLTFPGMTEVKLRPHQKNAAWRIMQSGNTLLAHVVGAGKTFAMASAAMELKRVGLAKKPMFVVPNHLVEQWGAEFVRLYPGANVFIAGKDFFAAGKRQRAMTRIASGNFDAIIVSHRSFEKLPVADSTFDDYMQEQVDELVEAIDEMTKAEGGKGKTVKQLEKAKKNLEAKMERRAAKESRDNAITFEELGVDQIFVDEAHMFKNLFFVSKMGRIAGLPNTESNRSFDMFMKTQYLTKRHNGRGVVFATGTPVANSMAELYTMQRYLQMQYLKDNNIQAFDAWASNFGESVTGLELAPEGTGYRMNTRFAKFVNIPELMTGFRMVADVQTATMLNLPRPKLRTGRAQSVTAPETEELKALVQNLAKRAAEIRTGRIDPAVDNMLKVTTEGRKAALDLRVLDPNAPDHPDSKLNRAVDKIHQIWQDTAKDSLTQVVFMDLSTPKAKGQAGFSAYNEMRRKLIEKGIPAKEIAFIHDAETDADKTALFHAVNTGRVRIIFGSTEKMGAGTNIQRKLVALHHMDAPWRPADIEQREGRILRQGNTNREVDIYQYLTQGSFDAYMWQILGNKAGFISKVMTGDLSVRSAEDVGQLVLSAEEFMAVASGNPAIKEKVGVDAELRKLAAVRTDYNYQQSVMRGDQQRLPGAIESFKAIIKKIEQDIAHRDANPADMKVGNKQFTGEEARKEFVEALDTALRSWKGAGAGQEIGSYRGFKLITTPITQAHGFPDVYAQGPSGRAIKANFNEENAAGTVQSLEYSVRNLESALDNERNNIATSEQKLKALKDEVGRGFDKEARYQELLKRQRELGELLNINKGEANAAAAPEATEDAAIEEEEEDTDEPAVKRKSTRRNASEAGFVKLDVLVAPFEALARRLRGNPTQRNPQGDYFKWSSAETEKRFQNAGKRQEEPKKIMDRLREANEAIRGMFRVYQHLPRDTYGRLIAEMTKLKHARGMASSKALLDMSKLIADMSISDFELLRKSVIADDLLETMELFAEKGDEIPEKLAFGFTPESLRADMVRLKKAVDERPFVANALAQRRRIWAEIKSEYLDAMSAAGEDVSGKLQRKNYYRHRVLLQKRLEAIAAAGGIKTPKGRGFLKKRTVENVGRDYATDFINTEIGVMTQLMIDTQTAKFIAYLKGNHDIIGELKKKAKWQNIRTVMPYFEEMAQAENDVAMASGSEKRVTGDDMFRRTLNRNQAMAIDELGRLASKNQLPDTEDGKWSELIDELATKYLARKDDEENGVEGAGGSISGDLLGYAAWVLRQKEANKASQPAGQLFKGIQAKRKAIERIAGENFVTWRNLVPEGYREYAVDPTKAFYSVFSIPEHLAMRVMEESAEAIGINPEDIKKVFAQGAAKDPLVLPDPVVKQFEMMAAHLTAARNRDNVVFQAARSVMGTWKQYMLHSPGRFIKYILRNQSGDIDSMLAGLPWGRTIRNLKKITMDYRKEVGDYFGPVLRGDLQGAVMSPELKKFASYGAFVNLLSDYETGKPGVRRGPAIDELSRWEAKEPSPTLTQKYNPMAGYSKYMHKVGVVNDLREALNRYAVYRIFLDDIRANEGKPTSYSASNANQIDQLETAEDKAYQMQNDLMGAYDELSVAGTWTRKWVIPFWAYQELNLRRYSNLIKNGIREGATATKFGKIAIGTAARAPYFLYKTGTTFASMYALWALLNALNAFNDDDDDKLRKDIRQRPHLTFGHTPDGKEVVYFSRLGNMADILELFDLEEGKEQFKAALNGQKPFHEAMWEAFRGGPMEKMILSSGPHLKYLMEASTNRTYFPNVDRPRVIEDWQEKIAQDLVLGDLYRRAAGKPVKPLSAGQVADMVIYRSDAKESAYYDIQEVKRQWMAANGLAANEFSSQKPIAVAMRNIKRSLRAPDPVAFEKYLKQYVALGGDAKSFESSLENMHPLQGLRKTAKKGEVDPLRIQFIDSLSAEDKARLELAIEYYNETFLGETADDYMRRFGLK